MINCVTIVGINVAFLVALVAMVSPGAYFTLIGKTSAFFH
jgi:hypothetical protein